MITIALAKGRQFTDFIKYIEKKGLTEWADALNSVTRELVVETKDTRFLLVKGEDVPTYVMEGIAELGITGSDILEENPVKVNNLMDLPFGYCHFTIASREEKKRYDTIATKYVNYTKRYFDSIMQPVKIIQLKGSVELAAVIGMADAIVDIVQSGETLRKNGLEERVTLSNINTRLISNRHAYFVKYDEIQNIMNQLRVE